MNSNGNIEEFSGNFAAVKSQKEIDSSPCEKQNDSIYLEINDIKQEVDISSNEEHKKEINVRNNLEVTTESGKDPSFTNDVNCFNPIEKERTVCDYVATEVKCESTTTVNSSEKQRFNQIKDESTVCGDIARKEICESNNSEKEGQQYDFSLPNLPEDYRETYDTYINEVKAMASVSIVNSVSAEYIENFKPYNMRYYEDKYCVNCNTSEQGFYDTLIRIHTNKLLLLALANGHEIIRNNQEILYINFVINNNDRSKVNLKGKRKKGSKAIEPQTILCQVKCKGSSRIYNIRAGIYGRIFEINEHIKTNPDLIRTDPKGLGFIAVLIPLGNPDRYDEHINKLGLLSREEYLKHLAQRPLTPLLNENQ